MEPGRCPVLCPDHMDSSPFMNRFRVFIFCFALFAVSTAMGAESNLPVLEIRTTKEIGSEPRVACTVRMVSPKQIKDLLSSGSAFFTEYLSPEQFEFPEEVGVEERENLIAELASDDSDELNGGKGRFVLAVDLRDEQLNSEKLEIDLHQIAALLIGDELAWFSPEEIEFEISIVEAKAIPLPIVVVDAIVTGPA